MDCWEKTSENREWFQWRKFKTTFQIIFISNIHFSIGIQCILNIENDMKKKRKYIGWQNHVSRTAVIASNALDHDPDANHIFIYEISRVRSIKNKKTNHTTFRTRNWSKQWYERFNKSIISSYAWKIKWLK